MKNLTIAIKCQVFAAGCDPVDSPSRSTAAILVDRQEHGASGLAEWQDTIFLRMHDIKTAYKAAISGLTATGFALQWGNRQEGIVVGELEATDNHWKAVAGVYIQPDDSGAAFKAIIDRSGDIGLGVDRTALHWVKETCSRIGEHLLTASMNTDAGGNTFD